MEKVKLTKHELKKQKDDLKRFARYLPTLALKKQQLQLEIIKILNALRDLESRRETLRGKVYRWVAVFAEDIHFRDLLSIEKVHFATGNIAGVDIPVFEKIEFREKEYDFMTTPLWVDYGIKAVKELAEVKARTDALEKQLELIRAELRITTQRVNLFEKVKIPEAREKIRMITIFLGDLMTAAVVTGKIAKAKIEKKIRATVEI